MVATATPKRAKGPRPENALTPAERQALAAACIPRCKALARTFQGRGLDSGDLLGEALLACVEAARVWVPGGEPGRAWDPSGAGAGTPAAFTSFAIGYAKKRLRGLTIERFRAAERVAVVHHEPDELAGAEPDGEWDGLSGDDRLEALAGEIATEVGAAVRRMLFAGTLGRLSPTTREVVELIVIQNVDIESAAVRLGRPVKDLKLLARSAAALLTAPSLTPDQTARGVALVRAGGSRESAAASLGVSRKVVGWHWPAWQRAAETTVDWDRGRELFRAGGRPPAVASALGVGRRLLTLRWARWEAEAMKGVDVARGRELFAAGRSLRAVASALGVRPNVLAGQWERWKSDPALSGRRPGRAAPVGYIANTIKG